MPRNNKSISYRNEDSNNNNNRSRDKKEKKKAFKKQTNEYLVALEQFCRDAQKADNMLESLKLFTKYNKNNLTLDLQYHKSEIFDDKIRDEIFVVFEQNMRDFYERSEVGWIKSEKWEELFDEDARYILARDQNNLIHGFVHLRFVVEDNQDVLYCYEIQVNKISQSKGLGTFLMKLLELIAFYNGFSKIMLTVFDINEEAKTFYKNKLGYAVDPFSPDEDEECDYEILSKVIKNNPKIDKPKMPESITLTG